MSRLRFLVRVCVRLGVAVILGPLATARADPRLAAAATTASAPDSLRPTRYHFLETRLTPREPFNAAADKVRILGFLSPSCQRCLKNAGELQREVLEKNPTQDLAVILIWLKVLSTDTETAAAAAAERFSDPRITHYWDPARLLNAQLLDAITFDINLSLYDVFLLYDKKTVWGKRLPRPGYWMQEYKGAPGPWWNASEFAAQVAKGLRGEPFTPPLE